MGVFSLAGATIVRLKAPILGAILPQGAPRWERTVTYLFVMVPIYQVLLMIYGTVLGQFSFFWSKEKAMARFLSRPFRRLIAIAQRPPA